MQSEDTAVLEDQTETAAGAASESDEITSLGELLAQDEIDDSGESAESSGSEEKTKLTKFNDLAGKLDIKLDDLYKLEITSSEDGEAVTIETLKDLYTERSEFDLAKLEFEETRTEKEQDLMRSQNELTEILQALPRNAVRPEVLDKIRAKSEAVTKLERQKTLDAIKPWADAKVRENDIAGMSEQLEGYGFPVGYLENVVDHRLLKYIRDSWQREQRMREAIAKVRAGKPDKAATATPKKKAPAKKSLASIKPKRGENKLKAIFSNLD